MPLRTSLQMIFGAREALAGPAVPDQEQDDEDGGQHLAGLLVRRQDEDDADAGDPQDGGHGDRTAPAAEVPGADLSAIASKAGPHAGDDGQTIRDIESDHGDG